MAIRVLVVDDSRFFRRRVADILGSDASLEVIATAENGAEAVEMAARLKPDVITMDIEMPVLDGISAVRRIMARNPTPILMFSSLTTDGAQATLDALDAGAVDFLPKRFEDISRNRDEASRVLCQRVRQIGSKKRIPSLSRPRLSGIAPAPQPISKPLPNAGVAPSGATKKAGVLGRGGLRKFSIVAIGTSTGGPVALQEILSQLPADFPLPIVLVQHMPSTFTAAFAQRLDKLCRIDVREAKNGDVLAPGLALLAPGGKQLEMERRSAGTAVRVVEPQPNQTYKPSVDVTFSSLAGIFPGKVLSIVLTGMGADGREGVRLLKDDGSVCWIQDEESCVVFGMPGAVKDANLADHIVALADIGSQLVQGM